MRVYCSQGGTEHKREKMVDTSLHLFVLIKQTNHSHLVIQLSNSTGCPFSVVDWQRKNRPGNFHKDPAKTVLCN